MVMVMQYAAPENQDEKESLVRQAETLAYSTDWRDTARTMRALRRRWRQIEVGGEFQNDPLSIRFRLALQTFLDRRAEHFQRAHQEKGKRISEQLTENQEQAALLLASIQSYQRTLRDYEEKLNHVEQQDRSESIKSFIVASIHSVQDEIDDKERQLKAFEKEALHFSTLFHGAGA